MMIISIQYTVLSRFPYMITSRSVQKQSFNRTRTVKKPVKTFRKCIPTLLSKVKAVLVG